MNYLELTTATPRLIVLTLLLSLSSCTSNEKESPSIGKTKGTVDPRQTMLESSLNLISTLYPQDYTEYKHTFENDYIQEGYSEFGIGAFDLGELPVHLEFYKLNLQGDEKDEYAAFIFFGPIMSWENYGIIFNDKLEAIDTLQILSKDGLCQVDFKHLHSTEHYTIITEWEQSISVYRDAGLNMYRLADDSIDDILYLNALHEDRGHHGNPKDLKEDQVWLSTSEPKYLDNDNGTQRFEYHTLITLDKERQDTLRHTIKEYNWSQKLDKFDITPVVSYAL